MGGSLLSEEPIPRTNTCILPEGPTINDIHQNQHEILLKPTSTWNRKILLCFFSGLAIIAMLLSNHTADNMSITVSDPPFGLIGSYAWTLKEKMGLARVEYDTEAVASALLDQSEYGPTTGSTSSVFQLSWFLHPVMSLQGAYLATHNYLSAPDRKLQYQP
jgi:hypothetical protein